VDGHRPLARCPLSHHQLPVLLLQEACLGDCKSLKRWSGGRSEATRGPVSPERDPNFRQLSRILVRPLEIAPSAVGPNDSSEFSDPDAQNAEALSPSPRQDLEPSNLCEQRADGSNFRGYGGKGGGRGKGSGGGKGGGQSNDDDAPIHVLNAG
jgi:hypothetical protein